MNKQELEQLWNYTINLDLKASTMDDLYDAIVSHAIANNIDPSDLEINY